MKIFDCFMYFDEDILLEIRLNILDKYIDYFIIVESKYTHSGKSKPLKFDIKKYENFKNKIIYLVHDESPLGVKKINNNDNEGEKSKKFINNAYLRENSQRNFILKGLDGANKEDLILISDLDEIPDLTKVDLKNSKEKIILFEQNMFYYKFNLMSANLWVGSKCCKKKFLKSPQWLRDVKGRKYSPFRIDLILSDNKYINVKLIKNGGWHFTNLKKPSEIREKLSSYLHHREFDVNPLSSKDIEKIINKRKTVYDLGVDKKINKFGEGKDLIKVDTTFLPNFINKNKDKYKEWFDQ